MKNMNNYIKYFFYLKIFIKFKIFNKIFNYFNKKINIKKI